MTVVVTWLQDRSDFFQIIFAFGVPVLLVRWVEKRRMAKAASRDALDAAPHAVAALEITSIPAVADREPQAAGVALDFSGAGLWADSSSVKTAKRVSQPSGITKHRKPETKPTGGRQVQNNGWVPAGETVEIAGREVDGMVYVGTPPRRFQGTPARARAYIDPAAQVAKTGADKAGRHMPYWPNYADLTPQCRAAYLDWLADGCSDASFNPGYMFLYFYGLERRFLLEQPSKSEKAEILAEVRRLKALYPENGSVQRYLGDFIQLAQVSLTEADQLEPVFDHHAWELPLSLMVAVGSKLERGEPLFADWVLSWLLCHPESRIRTAAQRCREEFHALFKMRFDEQFPEGMKVSKPRKALKVTYHAASAEFEATLEPEVDGAVIRDISGLRKPVSIAQNLADGAMDELDKLSRYLGRNPDGRGSLEAQALLPQALWGLFPSQELEQLKDWTGDIIAQGGLIPVAEVVERLDGQPPEKLGKRELTGAADALAQIGCGFAPDPRFALRAPKLDEPVVLFDLGEAVARLEEVSPAYQRALIEGALGAFVAHADGQITPAERIALQDKASRAEGLNRQEHRRLAANLEWLLAVAPDLNLLRRKLKGAGAEEQATIRAALVEAAHADGILQSEEVAGIEKIYRALGLDPSQAYSDLHAFDARRGPVRIRKAVPAEAGEKIPADTTPPAALDHERIAAIREDTAKVSTVLGDIFGDLPGEEPSEQDGQGLLAGLDGPHTQLVRHLVGRDHWSREGFDKLCSDLGLMAAGALENINEWAFDTYEEPLLDEYDGYELSTDIAAALKQKFATEEDQDVQIETA